MKSTRTLAAFLCLATALASARAWAGDPSGGSAPSAGGEAVADDPDAPEVHEDVVVSATRTEKSARDVPVSVTVIPQAAIEAAPVHTVDDLLRDVPGLNLPAGNSTFLYPASNGLSMRGLGGNRALVLLDGVPLNDPFSGYIPWNKISPATVDRIEVVRGGAASLFGNYAMSGIVNVVTRPADAQRLWAQATYGSYATGTLDAAVSQPISDNLGLGVNVDTFNSDGFQRLPADQRGPIDAPFASRSRLLGMRLDRFGNGDVEGFLAGHYFDSHLVQGTRLAQDDRRQIDGAAGMRWKNAWGGQLAANLFALTQEFNTDNTSLVSPTSRDAEYRSSRHEIPAETVGGSIEWSRPLSSRIPVFTAGLDVQRVLGEDRGQTFLPSGALRALENLGGRQDFGGLFVEADTYPWPAVEILASARLDLWRNFDGHDNPSTGERQRFPSSTKTQLDPRLAVRVDLGNGWAARGAGYRAFRAPTLTELYRTVVSKALITYPNPFLGPETLVGGDAGIDFNRGPVSAQLNVFVNRVTDLIDKVAIETTPVLTYQTANIGATRSRGVELFGQAALSSSWRVDAGFTYTDPKIVDNPGDRSLEGNLIPLIARGWASASVSYDASAGWNASLRGRYLTRRFQDAANRVPLDAAAVLDASISIPIFSDLDAILRGENILDRRYVADGNLGPRIGAPAQYFVGVRLRPARGTASPKRSN